MLKKEKTNEALLPINDFVFKRIFGRESNKQITKRLLSSIIEDEIKEITLNEETIIEKDLLEDKMGILDIKVKLENGTSIDIEMQVANQNDLEKRLLYYWSKLYSSNIKAGENYKELKRVIVIMFTNFNIKEFKDIEKYHTEWKIREKDYVKKLLTNDLELDIIEMSKVERYPKNGQNKELQTWVHFLTKPEQMEVKEMEDIEEIKMAKEELDRIRQDEREKRLAELRQKYIMDQNAIRDYGYDQGFEEGSQNEKIKMAQRMKNKNKSIEEIEEFTGLSKEEIEKLK